jgi:tetraspanin-5
MLLIALLLLEIGLGVLTFILKDKGWIKNKATDGLRNFILHYREDPDQQNLIDYIQTNWECCGIDSPSGGWFRLFSKVTRNNAKFFLFF